MTTRAMTLPLAAAFALCAAAARCETTIDAVSWQIALQVKSQKRNYHDIAQWMFPPSPKITLRPRAIAKLVNKSASPATALLLRYAFSARLKKIGAVEEGVWTVPFFVEERRIPSVRPSAKMDVPLNLNRVTLAAYLARMRNAGFWPDALRVQVMLEPRVGETFDGRIRESVLPIIWTPQAPNE